LLGALALLSCARLKPSSRSAVPPQPIPLVNLEPQTPRPLETHPIHETNLSEFPAAGQPAMGTSMASPPPVIAAASGSQKIANAPQDGHGTPVSFDLKDVDVREVLKLLAGVSGKEIIATDDVGGTITIKLDNVPWEDALDLIAKTQNLEVERMGNVIRVTSAARAAADEFARERSEPLRTEFFRLRYARAGHVADLLNGAPPAPDEIRGGEESMSAPYGLMPSRFGSLSRAMSRRDAGFRPPMQPVILSSRGRASADEPTNTLIVTDVQRGLDGARRLVDAIDIPAPQVEIDSRIVEVNVNFERNLGIQWGYRFAASPQTGNPTGLNFPGTIGFGGMPVQQGVPGLNSGIDPLTGTIIPFISDFPAGGGFGAGSGSALDLVLGSIDASQFLDTRLTQLEQRGVAKVLSRPRVVTRNNEEAEIKSVDILRVRLPASTVIGGYGLGVAFQSFEVGVELRVRPQVSSDGYVLLDLTAISSSLDNSQQIDSIPAQQERETEGHVLLRDGQTFVIGGIYRIEDSRSESGMPFLEGIPGLGWLFGGTSHLKKKQDLVIFVTPHSVRGTSNAELPEARQLWLNRGEPGS
jgi:type IV pilus assembly protein PilQ